MSYQTVLLIDDDEDDHELFVTAALASCPDVKCITFFSASEALDKLIQKEIRPDVIFLDLNMPLMNGQQFLMEIKKKENLKHIPVIIFSTSSHSSTIALTKELGAHDFITKPGFYDDLVDKLKPILC